MHTREPYVAGHFYSGTREALQRELAACLPVSEAPVSAVAVLAPHAGYQYSGPVAGELFGRVQVPGVVVLLGPNHTGAPGALSVWAEGQWRTPLGRVPVAEGLAEQVLARCPDASRDERAHQREHSLEVQVPFLQYRNPQVQIVPIVVSLTRLAPLQTFGAQLAEAIQGFGGEVLIVASSDLTHFESHTSAKARDRLVLDRLLELDAEGVYSTVKQHGISMCGYAPATAALAAARKLGARHAELTRYATSGEVSGDYGNVVGYAGMIFTR